MKKLSRKSKLALYLATAVLGAICTPSNLFAGSAQWATSPSSGDWNIAVNWNPMTVPNGLSDAATFGASNTTNVTISVNIQVSEIEFTSTANAFTITTNVDQDLTISGSGLTNNSGVTQNFVTASDNAGSFGEVDFTQNSSAGAQVTFTNNGGGLFGTGNSGGTQFFNTSSAGNATFVNNGVTGANVSGGATIFHNTSTASSGTFILNPALQNANTQGGGFVLFLDNSTAANGSFTTNGATITGAAGGSVEFSGSSTASNATITNNTSLVTGGGSGTTVFDQNSTAGQANIFNKGGTGTGLSGGTTYFFDAATAGGANITNDSGTVGGALEGSTAFFGSSTAGNAVLTNVGATVSGVFSGRTSFIESSTAGNSTLIANAGSTGGTGGQILFYDNSTGGTARVELFGNGQLDISNSFGPSLTIGSVEGDGEIFLGANKLVVGSNNATTSFSGVIQDGGNNGGTGGSLSKIGTGTLTLSGASTYTGGTTVSQGTLLVNNTTGSGTGSGPVRVTGGTLGGTGTIAGAVTVGATSGAGALISPGTSLGTLTIQKSLRLNSTATYRFELNSSTVLADKIVASGVTISGGTFSFTDLGSAHLALGTAFVIIDNTSNSAISGFFSNLADNSTFTNSGNTYVVSYEGGTGNDLTITVVPEPAIWQLLTTATVLVFVGTKIPLVSRGSR